jgi:hypothetical protein
VLELLVGEAHQGLECHLVTQPVIAADLQDLGADEPLHQSEHVGIGPALDLIEQSLFLRTQKAQCRQPSQALRQKAHAEVETAAANDVRFDIPAYALGGFDAARVACGVRGRGKTWLGDRRGDGGHGGWARLLFATCTTHLDRQFGQPDLRIDSARLHSLAPYVNSLALPQNTLYMKMVYAMMAGRVMATPAKITTSASVALAACQTVRRSTTM